MPVYKVSVIERIVRTTTLLVVADEKNDLTQMSRSEFKGMVKRLKLKSTSKRESALNYVLDYGAQADAVVKFHEGKRILVVAADNRQLDMFNKGG